MLRVTRSLLAGCLIVAASARAQVLVDDGFEYADSPAAHGWTFTPFGDAASIYTTTDRARSGDRSVLMDSLDDDEQRLRHLLGGVYTNLVVTAWMYDDMRPQGHFTITPQGPGNVVANMGVRTSSSATHYSTDANCVCNWQVTSVARSLGWHEMRYEIRPTGVDYFIDGTHVRHSGHLVNAEAVQLLSGNHGYGPENALVWFDDVLVVVDDGDADDDGVADVADNCVDTPNPDQLDTDSDGIGDACDDDDDGDGAPDGADNCPFTGNSGQEDSDGDGLGDACDGDPDGDGVGSGDNCELVPNPDQTDTDADGFGDECDPDADGDGVCEGGEDVDGTCVAGPDNCPTVPNPDQTNDDMDEFGDACDASVDVDLDADGVLDGSDACPGTDAGAAVDAAGCSVAQLCPCAGPRGSSAGWRNHGQHVSCVARAAGAFVSLGLMTSAEKDATVAAAADSDCGR